MNDLSRAVEKPPHRKHKPTLPPPSYEKILVDGTVIQHYGKDTDACTFDPEEAGFPRNTSIMDIPPDTARSLSTVTINFVKFLSDPTLRAGAYRLEQVRAVLREQGVELDTTTHDVAASLYGKSTTPTRAIPAREPLQARDQREAQQMLTTIIDKRKESIVL